jgi:recombination protein RecA
MALLSRAVLESLLRAKKLDQTLTTALPPIDPRDEVATASTGIAAVDAALGGGFPRGHLSELVGPHSSGRTSLLLQALAAATRRGELAALVDALDTFDVESGADSGCDFSRLLWIRGRVVPSPGFCRDMNQRALEQALRALTLVLQAGLFGIVVFDAAGVPSDALRRLPFTTWLRLQRMVEGSQTACVLVGSEQMARSSSGLTVRLAAQGSWLEKSLEPPHTRLFHGLQLQTRVVRACIGAQPDCAASFETMTAESRLGESPVSRPDSHVRVSVLAR